MQPMLLAILALTVGHPDESTDTSVAEGLSALVGAPIRSASQADVYQVGPFTEAGGVETIQVTIDALGQFTQRQSAQRLVGGVQYHGELDAYPTTFACVLEPVVMDGKLLWRSVIATFHDEPWLAGTLLSLDRGADQLDSVRVEACIERGEVHLRGTAVLSFGKGITAREMVDGDAKGECAPNRGGLMLEATRSREEYIVERYLADERPKWDRKAMAALLSDKSLGTFQTEWDPNVGVRTVTVTSAAQASAAKALLVGLGLRVTQDVNVYMYGDRPEDETIKLSVHQQP